MDSKLQRYCDGLLEAGWLAAVIVTPLFFNIHSSRVFEPDKLTLLRSIAVFMAVVWLVRFIDRQGWRSLGWISWRSENSIWRMPFVLPVFLLAVIYVVSSLFSITPVVSWAGSYQRLQGTYTTLSYIVIFALMLATIRDRSQVTRVITTVIVTSIPVALYAMLQHFDLDPLPWGGDTQRRVAGSMGNSIFIAAYLIMVVPLTFARIIDAFTNILTDDELDAADVIRSAIYIFALAIQLIAIFWTSSRGPFLGLAVSMYALFLILLVTLRNARSGERRLAGADLGRAILLVLLGTVAPLMLAATVLQGRISALTSLGVFIGAVGLLALVILVLALAGRGWRWLWLSWILLAVTMAGFLGLFNVRQESSVASFDAPIIGDTLKTIGSWRDLPEIGRFGRLLETEGGSGRVRVLIWEGALELLDLHEPLEKPDGEPDNFNFLRPVIGYGPESMYVAYNRFYPPELATIEARNASPDRSHNETFDAVVITGAAGLMAWQLLYLSVFYYGFRWLGVVKSNRDRNVLIGLWIGGAILGGGAITAVLGLPFVGVAVPFGAIFGLVVYLIYYAIISRPNEADENSDPFNVDRLIMIGLVAAVLAHYVEIHFGIAIASSRTHFFVYIALMFLIGYLLPRLKLETAAEKENLPKKRKKVRRVSLPGRKPGWVSPVLGATFVLALIIGVLAYNFMTYSLPDGETITEVEDIPSAMEIFEQSFLVNVKKGFVESPFVMLLLVLSWALGLLLFISELSKQGKLGTLSTMAKVEGNRLRASAVLFLALALWVAAGQVVDSLTADNIVTYGNLIYAAAAASVFAWEAYRLLRHPESSRVAAGVLASMWLIIAAPMYLFPEARLDAVIYAILSAGVLFLIWDKGWNKLLLPVLTMAYGSLGVGLLYALLHANMIRSGIRGLENVSEATPATVRRVMESDLTIEILSRFYLFLFVILFVTGLALAWERMGRIKAWGSAGGGLAMVILLPLAFIAISETNLQVIQADIVYKRADPWDKQGSRNGDPAAWDNAIAIYEHAIELAPGEDFYYLWLGRAYLERSSVTEDLAEQEALLRRAEERLIEAQAINPLNTDHTANLARLNTRWAELAADQARRERVDIASDYYEAAMSLSPNNAVIINEYARLAFVLDEDCEKAQRLFEHSIERDPYYANTLFEQYEVLRVCGDQQEDESEKLRFYEMAAESYAEGLQRRPRQAQDWLQLAGLYIVLGRIDDAVSAYDAASERRGDELEQWRIDFTMADWFFQEELFDKAEEFGLLALEGAPADVSDRIQQFIEQVSAARGQTDG